MWDHQRAGRLHVGPADYNVDYKWERDDYMHVLHVGTGDGGGCDVVWWCIIVCDVIWWYTMWCDVVWWGGGAAALAVVVVVVMIWRWLSFTTQS